MNFYPTNTSMTTKEFVCGKTRVLMELGSASDTGPPEIRISCELPSREAVKLRSSFTLEFPSSAEGKERAEQVFKTLNDSAARGVAATMLNHGVYIFPGLNEIQQ